jgi:hypothetical protein
MGGIQGTMIALLSALSTTAAIVPAAGVAQVDLRPSERTATELGQAVGELGLDGNGAVHPAYSRTPTELGQRVAVGVPADPANGFDWGAAAIGALIASGLMAAFLATAAAVLRHREPTARAASDPDRARRTSRPLSHRLPREIIR